MGGYDISNGQVKLSFYKHEVLLRSQDFMEQIYTFCHG